jgi:carboxymethylenebutenolidase
MCDDTTEAENERYLEQLRLGRREFGVGTGAVVAAFTTGCGPTPTAPQSPEAAAAEPASSPAEPEPEATPAITRRMVKIDMPDGTAEAFFAAPEGGRHPGVIMWPDVAGLREAYEQMAARLAGDGYAVVVVNQYYRSTTLPIFESFSQWRTDEGRARIAPMREAITPEGIAADGAALAKWLDQQAEVDPGRELATVGYCMGGPFTVRTAAAAPERVGAIASLHGGGLVTDEPSSPHRLLAQTKAAALICIAQNDDERQPEAKEVLRQAAEAAQLEAEIEVYPAQHGWCTIDSPVYDQAQAERARARMLVLFAAHL